nr:MAG TPA: hypothetical protein [Caudoviricetes sp.]DAK65402.1 MAG TPA: hypothetical protein [Caudoviricetes sp.]DAQ80452.1 MAG TPA: hypothetical protein [Herelleviridae sp.]
MSTKRIHEFILCGYFVINCIKNFNKLAILRKTYLNFNKYIQKKHHQSSKLQWCS